MNEMIKKIYSPLHKGDWLLVETDRGFYELRMGGFTAVSNFNSRNYEVTYEFSDNVIIEEAHTDEEALYFRLSNNQYLVHDFTNIDADGNTSASASILSKNMIEDDFGESFSKDSDFRKLKIDSHGNSD